MKSIWSLFILTLAIYFHSVFATEQSYFASECTFEKCGQSKLSQILGQRCTPGKRTLPGQCVQETCFPDFSWKREYCTQYLAPGCEIVEDKSKPFPDCCPTLVNCKNLDCTKGAFPGCSSLEHEFNASPTHLETKTSSIRIEKETVVESSCTKGSPNENCNKNVVPTGSKKLCTPGTYTLPGQCVQETCFPNHYWKREYCTQHIAPGCDIVEDMSKPYPDCCPKVVNCKPLECNYPGCSSPIAQPESSGVEHEFEASPTHVEGATAQLIPARDIKESSGIDQEIQASSTKINEDAHLEIKSTSTQVEKEVVVESPCSAKLLNENCNQKIVPFASEKLCTPGTYTLPGQCVQETCYPNHSWKRKYCTQHIAPGCEIVEDKSKPYPDCCPKVVNCKPLECNYPGCSSPIAQPESSGVEHEFEASPTHVEGSIAQLIPTKDTKESIGVEYELKTIPTHVKEVAHLEIKSSSTQVEKDVVAEIPCRGKLLNGKCDQERVPFAGEKLCTPGTYTLPGQCVQETCYPNHSWKREYCTQHTAPGCEIVEDKSQPFPGCCPKVVNCKKLECTYKSSPGCFSQSSKHESGATQLDLNSSSTRYQKEVVVQGSCSTGSC